MFDELIISPNLSVKETIRYMENNHIQAVVIANEDKKLMGLFSYGDMRRFFLSGGNLSDSITTAMNPNPILFSTIQEVKDYMEKQTLVLYPIVDCQNEIISIITNESFKGDEQINSSLKDVPLVIMAGGKGTRLYPYTKILPKALVPIGDYTITERIIKNFQKYGVQDVFMVLNHKANMIKSYFNDIEKDYNLQFVQEEQFLGTGGGLYLLKDLVKSTFVLSNCDILLDADLECIYRTHKMNNNKITFVCAMKNVQIPYGVVETNADGSINSFREKPEFSFLTNTGVYVIEREVLDDLNENEFIHLPDIAKRYLERGEKVGVFPISEHAWLDMGQFSEMKNMLQELGIQG